MLSTSESVLLVFPGHNHLLTTGADDPKLNYHLRWRSGDNQSEGSSALVVCRWLGPGNRTFLEVDSMVDSGFVAQWCLLNLFMCVVHSLQRKRSDVVYLRVLILGPLLFTVFVNDMSTAAVNCNLGLYADESTLHNYWWLKCKTNRKALGKEMNGINK